MAVSGHDKNTNYDSLISKSRSLIEETMTNENIPGLAVAIIDNNKIIWTEGFGFTDIDMKRKVTPETIFSIQSASKTITATAVIMAVQDHIINLDKPISDYLKAFSVKSRFEPNPQEKITMRRLLSHTAGFTMEAPLGNNCYPESPSFEKHIQSISDTWLRYPVGQRYSYSNLGVDLAGYILQVTGGKTFADYVKEKLLTPTGMNNSSFDMEIIRKDSNRAIGHSIYCSQVPLEVPMIPSGGFYTNVSDLAKFVQLYLNRGKVNGRRILKTEYIKEIYSIPFPVEDQYEGYALGIAKIWNDKYHVSYYNHNGGGFGFLSSMTWYPDYGIGLIILTNNDNNTIQYKLSDQIMDLLLGSEEPKNIQLPDLAKTDNRLYSPDPSELTKFAGRYLGRDQQLNVIIKDKVIFVSNDRDSSIGKFVAPNICRTGNDYYRFMPSGKTPAYMVRINDGATWDYNDGPNDPSGLVKEEWNNYTGTYTALLWGQTPIPTKIFIKNGYLYLTDNLGFENKLSEYKPGIFFTATGECLDFTGANTTFANILVRKVK
jgi:CubicO group peptidase (beta-lactamase class C family)